MGNNQSTIEKHGYTVVSKQEKTMLVKNKEGDQFVIKIINSDQEDVLNKLLTLSHPHIIQHKEKFQDTDCMYLVLEHCEGGDLSQKIKSQKETTFSEKEILDWTVKICMALKYLHDDKNSLHKNLQPKSISFTTCGTIRLGEFGDINERSSGEQTAESKVLSYVAPEIFSGKPYDEKSETWNLGCVIYELCMLRSAFISRTSAEIVTKILNSSYEALSENYSEDLRQLVKDSLQTNPERRPSVNEILRRPFIIEHLWVKSKQTIKELYERLRLLRDLAEGLESVHFGTTVGSLTGGVIGTAGGITALVGAILAPFTLGASLIVTGVGIGVAVTGGATAGVSNITNMVSQRSNRQNIKLIITEFQEKMTSTVCCIQNISEALQHIQNEFSTSNENYSNEQQWANAGARFGRGLGGIPELLRLFKVSSVGRIAAQTARVVRMFETLTTVFSALFLAVDVFFIVQDSREIHNIRSDRALIESQQESEKANTDTNQMPQSELRDSTNLLDTPANTQLTNTQQSEEQELNSKTMQFVKVIRETADQLEMSLGELRDIVDTNSETPETNN